MLPQSISVETDVSSSETSPTESYSPSTKTDHSPSPPPPPRSKRRIALSIDSAIDIELCPIIDSPVTKKRRHRRTNRKKSVLRHHDRKTNRKSRRKMKPRSRCKSKSKSRSPQRTKSKKASSKSPKRPHGFTKLLSLFTANVVINENEMKQLCHRQITQILSLHHRTRNDGRHLSAESAVETRYCSIIRNIEVCDKEKVCDVTDRIFSSFKRHKSSRKLMFQLWNLGLMMLFMVTGRRRICRYWHCFVDEESVQRFLCDLYLTKRISTNLFDLLSFYILIVDGDGMGFERVDIESRHRQITTHRWFHK